MRRYGIVEEYVGCPIISSMEVKKIGVNDEGGDVYDKNAAEADGIILGCRVKPHTAFRGPYESGLMKMMAIGLGKQYGAEVCHAEGFNVAKNVPLFGRCILKNAPILFGVPTIEMRSTRPARSLRSRRKSTRSSLRIAQGSVFLYAAHPCDSCDVLIVDQISKTGHGDGINPNITGTFCTPYATGGIDAQRVAVLDLSPETHGNGTGCGYSSATTKSAVLTSSISRPCTRTRSPAPCWAACASRL